MNFLDELKLIESNSDKTRKEISEAVGYSEGYMNKVFNGKQEPSERLINAIHRLYTSVAGKQPKMRIEQNIPPSAPSIIPPPSLRRGQIQIVNGRPWQAVPVISWAAAGKGTDFGDLETQIDECVMAPTRDPNAIAIIIEGESMEPRYCAGDIAVAEPNGNPRKGGVVVARLREDGGVIFKRCERTGEDLGNVILTSYNKEYKDIIRPRVDFRFIYPVVRVIVNPR